MEGSALGVCNAALWKSTIEPGFTFFRTLSEISLAVRFFQSRLSPLAAVGKLICRRDNGFYRVCFWFNFLII